MMKWTLIVGIFVLVVAGIMFETQSFRPEEGQVTDDWPPEVKDQVEASRSLRAEVRAEYSKLYLDLRKCLFRHDPVGINFETNVDEYDPEVGTIIPRLPDCRSQNDVLNVVHEEFSKWFGADVAGPKTNYTAISEDIWKIWKARKTQPKNAPDKK